MLTHFLPSLICIVWYDRVYHLSEFLVLAHEDHFELVFKSLTMLPFKVIFMVSDVDEWVLKKLISLQERINLAKNSLNMMTTANESVNSMMEENIDPGLMK